MCLAIPGKLTEVYWRDELPMGRATFGEVAKEICLACVPQARAGDYVLVHVGFAISIVDEQQAEEILALVEQMEGPPEREDPPELSARPADPLGEQVTDEIP